VDEPAVGGQSARASFGQRFGAYFVDWILLGFAALIAQEFVGRPNESGFSLRPILVNAVVTVAYFTLFEGSRSGQTLGKRLLSIRVVDFETGAGIDYTRALGRSLGRLLSGFILFIGYLWMLWDRDAQTWHDKLASTTVVRVVRPERRL
jgi:uncharacterized RDD family membrane protein YckC